MKKTLNGWLSGAFVCALAVNSAFAGEPTDLQTLMAPYKANYVVTRSDSNYGEGYRYLEVSPDNEWQLRTKTEISWFILSDVREARSVFGVNHETHQLEPKDFVYERTGTGSDKSFHGEFNVAEKKVRNADSGQGIDIDWGNALFDEANVTEQLRIDVARGDDTFEYPVVNEKGEPDHYRYKVVDQDDRLSLPYGKVDTIKVKRVRDSNRRETYFWFAPELNYVMVKMQQFKEGDEQATLSLKQLSQ